MLNSTIALIAVAFFVVAAIAVIFFMAEENTMEDRITFALMMGAITLISGGVGILSGMKGM